MEMMTEYMWQTYESANKEIENLTNSLYRHKMTPDIEGEGKNWRFVGIWLDKETNTPELTKIQLACMNFGITTIIFNKMTIG